MVGSRETVSRNRSALRILMAVALGSAAVLGVVVPAAAAGSFSIDLPIDDGWLYQHEGVNYLMPTPERRSDFYLEGAASSLEEQDFPVRIDVEATLLDGTEATLCSVEYTDTGITDLDWECDLAGAAEPIPSASAVWATLHTDDGEELTAWLDDTMILASPTFGLGPFPSRDGTVSLAGTKLASMGVEVYEGLLDRGADPEQEPLCTDLTSRSSTWACDAAVVVEEPDPTFISARMVPVPGVANPFGVPSEYRWTVLEVEVIDEPKPEPEPKPDPEPEPEPESSPEPDPTPTAEPDPTPEPRPQPGPAAEAGPAADTDRSAASGPGTGARDRADDESASPPAPAQDDPPSTTTEPVTTDEPGSSDDVSVTSARADPTEYGHSLRTVRDLVETPGGVLAAAAAAAFGFLFLVAIPAELLYATLRSNYGRVFVVPAAWRRRWDRVVGRLQGRAWRLLAAPAMVVGGAAIATFAEPDPSGPGVWLRVFLAMLLAVVAMNATAVVVGRSYAGREHLPSKVRLMPGFLLIAVASVAASRLADVQPGTLFGLLAMTAVTVPMSAEQSGKLAAAVCGAFVGVGLMAWLLYSLIAADAHGFGVELLREALTTVTIGGIGSIVVALLPLTFLSGHDLIRWSRPAWAALYGATLVLFCLIVLPMPESWAEADGVGIIWGGLFGAFGLISIATWTWFRFRAAPEQPQELAEA